VLTKFKSLKAAIVVGAVVLGVTGVAGARAGALPGPAQEVAHEMLGAVGVTVPGPSRDNDLSSQSAAEVAEAGQGAGSSQG
jgi:hypothetical protein